MNVLRWLSKQIVLIVFVCFLSVMTTLVVINALTERIMQQIGIESHHAKITFPQLLAQWSGQGNMIVRDAAPLVKEHSDGLSADGAIDEGWRDEGRRDGDERGGDSDLLEHPYEGEEAVEVWRSQSSRDQIVFSMEAFAEARDQLSLEEKMKIFTIVVDNIPPAEVQRLSEMMEEGLTDEEIRQIERMMAQYLNEQDYEALWSILNLE